MVRLLVRASCLLALVALPSVGHASPGKVKKAAKLKDKYEAGDKASLVEALGILEAAIEHPKVARSPGAWAMLGHLRYEAAKEAADPEGFADAARDLAMALEVGAEGDERDRVVADLKAILGTLFNVSVDALESRRHDEAALRMVTVLAVRQSLADAGLKVRALEERILALAVRVSIQQGELDDAVGFHGALLRIAPPDPGIAGLLARSLADADRMAEALELLEELARDDGGEPRLLRTHVELLSESGDQAAALERVDGQKESLWPSVSGSFLLAELYTIASASEQALEAFRRVLELDARHLDARLGAAGLLTAEADIHQATLDQAELKWKEKKELKGQIADLRTEVVSLLESALQDEPTRLDIGERLVLAHRAAGDEEAALAVQVKVDDAQGQP